MSTAEPTDELSNIITALRNVDTVTADRLKYLDDASNAPELQDQARVSSIDIYRAIDPTAFEERAAARHFGSTGWISWLEFFRNLIIFFPIFLTWWGLSDATTKYNNLVTQHPDSVTQPFLLSWQRGFSDLGADGSLFTFSGLAALDAGLLATVIFLTFFVDWKRNVSRNVALTRAARDRTALEDALWILEQRFAEIRYKSSPAKALTLLGQAVEFLPERTNDLLDHMAAERERLTVLAEKRERQYGDLKVFAKALDSGTVRLASAGNDLQQSYTRLEATVNAMNRQVSDQDVRNEKLLHAIEDLSTQSVALSHTVVQISQVLQTSLDEVASTASATTGSAQEIASAARELRFVGTALGASQDRLVDALGQVEESTRATTEDMRHVSTGLRSTVDHFAGVQSALASITNEAHSLNQSNSSISSTLAALSRQQESGAEGIVRSISTVGDISVRVSESAVYIAQQSQQLTEAVQSFAQVQRTVLDKFSQLSDTNAQLNSRIVELAHQQGTSIQASSETTASLNSLTSQLRDLTTGFSEQLAMLRLAIEQLDKTWSLAITSADGQGSRRGIWPFGRGVQ